MATKKATPLMLGTGRNTYVHGDALETMKLTRAEDRASLPHYDILFEDGALCARLNAHNDYTAEVHHFGGDLELPAVTGVKHTITRPTDWDGETPPDSGDFEPE